MYRNRQDPDFLVVGVQRNGQLIFRDRDGENYVTGEDLEEFGVENLFPEERKLLGIAQR